jgi:hypothetical protein
MPYTSHPPRLITLIIFDQAYKLRGSSLCRLLQSPVTSSLLGPYIFFSALFSQTPPICSSRSVWDQVSHPCRTTGEKEIWLCTVQTHIGSGGLTNGVAHAWVAMFVQNWGNVQGQGQQLYAVFMSDRVRLSYRAHKLLVTHTRYGSAWSYPAVKYFSLELKISVVIHRWLTVGRPPTWRASDFWFRSADPLEELPTLRYRSLPVVACSYLHPSLGILVGIVTSY